MELQPGTARQVAWLVERMQAEFAMLDEYDGGGEEEEQAAVAAEEDEEEEQEEEEAPARPVLSPRPGQERDGASPFQLPVMDRAQRGLEAVPEEAWSRPWLTRLCLARNRLAAVDGERLSGALSALTSLDLSHNPLEGGLALRLPALRELRLSGCPLAALALAAPGLELLALDGARLEPPALAALLAGLPRLASLSLAGCGLPELPAELARLPLTHLEADRNRLLRLPPLPASLLHLGCCDNPALAALGPLPPRLQRCLAARCALEGLELAAAAALERLDVRHNRLAPALDARPCAALRELQCGHNAGLERLELPEGLQALAADCCGLPALPRLPAALERLWASCCPRLAALAAPLPHGLTELRLCFAPRLAQLPPLPSALCSLWLSHCPLLAAALPPLPALRSLVFSASPGVVPPAPLPPGLTVLRAAGCPHRLDLAGLAQLEQLDVSRCPLGEPPLAAAGLREVECEGCPWLALEEGEGESHRFAGPPEVGAAQSLGLRPTMEDAWGSAECGGGGGERLLVLCDGHAGREAASFVAAHLLAHAAEAAEDAAAAVAAAEAALRRHLAQGPAGARHAGTTVLLAARRGPELRLANVGDSRAVRVESAAVFERLSRDHKPWEEEAAVRGRGGWVAAGRLNGVLGVSRALGDYYLQPALSAAPSLAAAPARGRLLLACDGLWDEVPDALAARLAAPEPPEPPVSPAEAAARLRDAALALGSDDNVSVLVWQLD